MNNFIKVFTLICFLIPTFSYAVLTQITSNPNVSYYEVDGSRNDVYTEDGGLAHPYKTIMGCINRIIANGDNASNKPYGCHIHGPNTYVENIILENTHLTDIYMTCLGVFGSCMITPASGNALQSSANNDQLHLLNISGLVFNNPVVLSNGGGAHFLENSGYCSECVFNSTTSLTNAGDWELHGGFLEGDVSVNASSFFTHDANGVAGVASTNGSTTIFDVGSTLTGTISNDATSTMVCRGGSRLGTDAGSLTNSGTLQLYPCFSRSHITNSGTMQVRGGTYRSKDLVNTGTLTREVPLDVFSQFVSSTQVGTGATQSIAHGLGYKPNQVLIVPVTTSPSGYSGLEAVHDSSNVNVTVTVGAKYKVFAF